MTSESPSERNTETINAVSINSALGGFSAGVQRVLNIQMAAYYEEEAYCQAVLLDRMEEEALECGPILQDAEPKGLSCDLLYGKCSEKDLGRIFRLSPKYLFLSLPSRREPWVERLLSWVSANGLDAEWESISASQAGSPMLGRRIYLLAFPAAGGRARLYESARRETGGIYVPPGRCEGVAGFTEDWTHRYLPFYQSNLCGGPLGAPAGVECPSALRALGRDEAPAQVSLGLSTLLTKSSGFEVSDNPYKLELPACVSFSGGRSSAFMLYHILEAHGGQPDGLEINFENTGLEHKATYKFVRECGKRWGIRINWLEYGRGLVDPGEASMDGEPFSELVEGQKYLPNPMRRTCTARLKIRTGIKFMASLYPGGWINAIGLRADEPHRVHRLRPDSALEIPEFPMYRAGHTEADVNAFWEDSEFDLELDGNAAGNCVGCFLKGKKKLAGLYKKMPEYFSWWLEAEHTSGRTFKRGSAYKDFLFTDPGEDELDLRPCHCTD